MPRPINAKIGQIVNICCVSETAAQTALDACNGSTSQAIERILRSAPAAAAISTSPPRQRKLQWKSTKSTKLNAHCEEGSAPPSPVGSTGGTDVAVLDRNGSDIVELLSSSEDEATACASETITQTEHSSRCDKVSVEPSVALCAGANSKGSSPSVASLAAHAAASPLSAESSTTDTDICSFCPWAHVKKYILSGGKASTSRNSRCESGVPLAYQLCAESFAAVDATKGRLQIMDILTNMFRAILAHDPSQAIPAVYLAGNKLAPASDGVDLNVGGSAVAAAVREVTGASRAQMSALYKTHGDLGDVAAALKQKQRLLMAPAPLSIPGVFASLHRIAEQQGKGSAANRHQAMCTMLRACKGAETQYLVRTLLQHLRIGVSMDTILGAVSRASALHVFQTATFAETQNAATASNGVSATAHTGGAASTDCPGAIAFYHFCGHGSVLTASDPRRPVLSQRKQRELPPDASSSGKSDFAAALGSITAACKIAYSMRPDPGAVVRALIARESKGVASLQAQCVATPGQALKPMLAKIARGFAAAQEAWGSAPFAAEYKYDGQRAQIHMWSDDSSSPGDGSATDLGQTPAAGLDSAAGLSRGHYVSERKLYSVRPSISTGRAIRVFSRHLENTTQRWLDVCATIAQLGEACLQSQGGSTSGTSNVKPSNWYPCIAAFDKILGSPAQGVRSCILDAEVIAVEPAGTPTLASGEDSASAAPQAFRIRPFQELSTRSRVLKVAEGPSAEPNNSSSTPSPTQHTRSQEIQVCTVIFDVIEWNGVSLQSAPYWFRRAVLERHLGPRCRAGTLQLADQIVTNDVHSLEAYLKQSVQDACEGLMLKLLGEPSATLPAAVQSLGSTRPQLPCVHETGDSTPKSGSTAPAAAAAVLQADQAEADCFGSSQGAGTRGRKRVRPPKLTRGGEQSDSPPLHNSSGSRAALEAGAGTAAASSNARGAGYEPAKRSDAWLKLKQDYIEGMGDTLDLVPIGGWWGNGRKAGWFSPILLAAYDADSEQYCSVCRCMSGFTDEFYKQITQFYSMEANQLTPAPGSGTPPLGISTSERPPVWFKPCAVWELKGADFSLSPVHTAGFGLVAPDRGISVRFPRFLKERPDKTPEDSTSCDDLADMYLAQSRRVQPTSHA